MGTEIKLKVSTEGINLNIYCGLCRFKFITQISICQKEGDVLLPILFNFTLYHAIRKVQKNQERLEMNGTHQLQVLADNINLPGKNVSTLHETY